MLKGWRTLIVNFLLLLPEAVPLLLQLLLMPELPALIPAEYKGHYLVLVGAINVWLRFQTTTPVGKRE